MHKVLKQNLLLKAFKNPAGVQMDKRFLFEENDVYVVSIMHIRG